MIDLGWGWEKVRCIIKEKFSKESWYNDILFYLLQRYASIEARLIGTFRYVACHPENRNTFSYEYASILRDSGSVFSSVLDRLIRETTAASKETDISDYKKWLLKLDIPRCIPNRTERIYFISVDINYPLEENVLLPFLQWRDEKGKLKWWEAYNNVKHSDVNNFRYGNLENAMNSVAALAVILALFTEWEGQLFINPGFYHPEEYLNKRLFFKADIS